MWRIGVLLAGAVLGRASVLGETVWTLESASREMADRHPDWRAGEEAVNSAEARLQVVYGRYQPQVSAGASMARSGDGYLFEEGGVDSFSAGVDLRQTLFEGWRTKALVDQRTAERDSVRAAFDDVKARLGQDLQRAFADLLYAQENVELTQSILERRTENMNLVELRYEGGREHKGSYLRIKAGTAQARFDVGRAQREARLFQTALARAMGRDLFEALAATGPFRAEAPGEWPNTAELVLQTPAVRRSRADQRSAEAGAVVARSEAFPSIEATLSQSWPNDRWSWGDPLWRGGLSLSWPLWTGGRIRQGIASARADARRAEALARSIHDQAVTDLSNAWINFRNAVDKRAVTREFLEAADVRAMIARRQYTSGLLSFEDWDIIENDLISNRRQWLADRRDAARAQADWDRARGVVP